MLYNAWPENRLLWWIATLLTVSTTVLTDVVLLYPQNPVLYQNRDRQIVLCVQTAQAEVLCGLARSRVYRNASCSVRSHSGAHSNQTRVWKFRMRMDISLLAPGTYWFDCKTNDRAHPVRTQRVVLASDRLALDCAGWSDLVSVHELSRPIRICCLRPRLRTEWIYAQMDGSPEYCTDPVCLADHKHVTFYRGWLQFSPFKTFTVGTLHVRCHGGQFSRHMYIYDPGQAELVIKLIPSDPVLCTQSTPQLSVCLGWSNQSGCLSVNQGQSKSIQCELIPLVDNWSPGWTTVNFLNQIDLKVLPEGTYSLNCTDKSTNLQASAKRHVIHRGSYRWSCENAPNIIYLDQASGTWIFCTWTLSASAMWTTKLRPVGFDRKPFNCTMGPSGLVFADGVLSFSGSNQIPKPGIYRVSCNGRLVNPRLIIADKPKDLQISILPLSGLVNRSLNGKLWAQMKWYNVSYPLQRFLETEFPVTCQLHYPELGYQSPVRFTRSLHYENLAPGLMELDCSCPTIGVRAATVRKLVVGQPGNRTAWWTKTSPVQLSDYLGAKLVQQISAATDSEPETKSQGSTPVSGRCAYPEVTYHYLGESLEIRVAPWDEQSSGVSICPNEQPGSTFLVHAEELKLVVDPVQLFYTFHQNPPVHIHVSLKEGTPYELELLRRIPVRWIVTNPSGYLMGLAISPINGRVKNFVSFASRSEDLSGGVYSFKCLILDGKINLQTSLTIVPAESIKLVITGLNKKFHFIDVSHTYTCFLDGLGLFSLARERYKPRWRSMLPGSKVAEIKNAIRITETATLGAQHYQCYYKDNGLDLIQNLRFHIVEQQNIRLKLDFLNRRFLVFEPHMEKPFVRCESSYLGTVVSYQPNWRSLDKTSDYVSTDRSDYFSGKADLTVDHQTPGLSTFQCILTVQEHCFSRLVVFWRKTADIRPQFMPQLRQYVVNSTVRCVDGSNHARAYANRMQVITDYYGFLEDNDRQIVWTATDFRIANHLAIMECRLEARYMDYLYSINSSYNQVNVFVPISLDLLPKSDYYRAGETVNCVVMTNGSLILSDPILHLLDASDRGLLDDARGIKFPEDFPGQRHRYTCTLYMPNSDAIVHEGWFDFYVPSKHINVKILTRMDEVIGWQFLSDGYPTQPALYKFALSEELRGLLTVKGNIIMVTEYTMTDVITVRCTVEIQKPEKQRLTELFDIYYFGKPFDHDRFRYQAQVRRLSVFIILNLMSCLAVALIVVVFCVHICRKKKAVIDSEIVQPVKEPQQPTYVVLSTMTLGRADFYYTSAVVKLFSDIHDICMQLHCNRTSVRSYSETSAQTVPTRDNIDSTVTSFPLKSSAISSQLDDEPLTSIESILTEVITSRLYEAPRRRSIMIMGETGTNKVPLIISGADGTRKLSTQLDQTALTTNRLQDPHASKSRDNDVDEVSNDVREPRAAKQNRKRGTRSSRKQNSGYKKRRKFNSRK